MKLLSLAAALLLPGLAAATDWPTYQGGAAHTGYVPVSLNLADAPPLRWQAHPFANDISASGIAIGAGRVFVTPQARFDLIAPLVSLDLGSGEERWRVDFGDVASVNPPALDGEGTVYLATGNHTPGTWLHAYDSETGVLRWRSAMEAQWERYLAPTIVDNQVASNGGYYGGLYVFDRVSGQRVHFTGLGQCDQMTPVPWRDSWVTLTRRLDVINRATGALRSINLPNQPVWCLSQQTPLVLGDTVYLNVEGRLLAMDLVSGSLLFERAIGAYEQISTDGRQLFFVSSGAVSIRDLRGDFVGALEVSTDSLLAPLIVTDTHVIGATTSYARTAILDRSGQRPPVLLPRGGRMALANGLLVIAAQDGIYAYDVAEGLFADGFEQESPATPLPVRRFD